MSTQCAGETGGTSYQWGRDQTLRRNRIPFEDHLTSPKGIECVLVASLHVYHCAENRRYFIPMREGSNIKEKSDPFKDHLNSPKEMEHELIVYMSTQCARETRVTSYYWSRDQTLTRNQITFEDHLISPKEIYRVCVSTINNISYNVIIHNITFHYNVIIYYGLCIHVQHSEFIFPIDQKKITIVCVSVL